MDIISIVLVALGLSADVFAVGITKGATIKNIKKKQSITIALLFGIFHCIMPILGRWAGVGFKTYITNVDHRIAFALLIIIGGKMIYEACWGKEEDGDESLQLFTLLGLAVAVSIDSLAVGISFSFLDISITFTSLIIGGIACIASFIGIYIGKNFGGLFKNKIEIIGGGILVAIGIKILVQHLY